MRKSTVLCYGREPIGQIGSTSLLEISKSGLPQEILPSIQTQPILSPTGLVKTITTQAKLLKGVSFSKETPHSPQTSDLLIISLAKADFIRMEVVPTMTANDLNFIHNNMHMKVVFLLGRSLIPSLTTADWQGTGSGFTQVLSIWEHTIRDTIKTISGSEIIDYAEIWNEPNTDLGNASGTGLPAQNFAKLYRVAYNVIKSLSPKTHVISGGIFSHATSGAEYLAKVRAADKSLPIEYCGWHPYLDSGGGLQVEHFRNFIATLHSVARCPLFITECGWSTSVVTPQAQANNLSLLFTEAKSSPNVHAVSVFSFDDVPEAKPPLNFGIWEKPAWQVFKSV